MKLYTPKIPFATRHNAKEFACAWMYAKGGTYQNALKVWNVEATENLKRDLSVPFKPLFSK